MAKNIFESGNSGAGVEIIVSRDGLQEITAHLLVSKTGQVESSGEAKRLIRGKAVKINDIIIEDDTSIFNNFFFGITTLCYNT